MDIINFTNPENSSIYWIVKTFRFLFNIFLYRIVNVSVSQPPYFSYVLGFESFFYFIIIPESNVWKACSHVLIEKKKESFNIADFCNSFVRDM